MKLRTILEIEERKTITTTLSAMKPVVRNQHNQIQGAIQDRIVRKGGKVSTQ